MVTTLPAAGGRIGLLADTHCDPTRRLPARVWEVFNGVDLIVHLGDCGAASTLTELERIAPVVATRGGDDASDDSHYADHRVLEVGGLTIGTLFDLSSIGIAADERGRPVVDPVTIADVLFNGFGRRVDVVASAATHQPWVAHCADRLLVNPGSATLPAPPARATVAVIECRDRVTTIAVEPL